MGERLRDEESLVFSREADGAASLAVHELHEVLVDCADQDHSGCATRDPAVDEDGIPRRPAALRLSAGRDGEHNPSRARSQRLPSCRYLATLREPELLERRVPVTAHPGSKARTTWVG